MGFSIIQILQRVKNSRDRGYLHNCTHSLHKNHPYPSFLSAESRAFMSSVSSFFLSVSSVTLPMLKKVRCSFQGAALMFQRCSRLLEKETDAPYHIALATSRYFFRMIFGPIIILHYYDNSVPRYLDVDFHHCWLFPLEASFVSESAGANPMLPGRVL